MHNDSTGRRALASMAAARAFYETIPVSYAGRGHLGQTIIQLDELVARVSALRGNLGAKVAERRGLVGHR